MKFNVKYYLVESGEVLDVCNMFREDTVAWHNNAWEYLKTINATSFQLGGNGSIRAVGFAKNSKPKGFKIANRQGCCVPYKKSEWVEKLEALGKRPDAEEYLEPIIKAPRTLEYKTRTGSGSTTTGHPFAFYQILWFDKNGPFCVALPDIEKDIRLLIASERATEITNDTSMNIPPGLKEILVEEWDLMVAKSKKEKDAA